MGIHDRIGLVGKQAGGPQAIGQVRALGLELGGQPAVQQQGALSRER
jgi:hypothetical protein